VDNFTIVVCNIQSLLKRHETGAYPGFRNGERHQGIHGEDKGALLYRLAANGSQMRSKKTVGLLGILSCTEIHVNA